MNALTIGERIKKVRRSLELTQQEFADRIGSKRNTIATYEMGRTEPSAAVISLICTKFNVSETWLRTGKGEMNNAKSSAAMEALARERGLTHSDFVLIEKFLNMKPQSRLAVAEYMLEVAAALDGDSTPLDSVAAQKNPDIDTEVGHYRTDLLMDEDFAAKHGTGRQASAKAPQEMTDEELHAVLDRQLTEEKKQAESGSAS